jgi:hypothetical protein
MNLIIVQCSRSARDEAEARLGVVIAADQTEAEELRKKSYASEGFHHFKADTVVLGSFDGPSRVLGYTGQKRPWNK